MKRDDRWDSFLDCAVIHEVVVHRALISQQRSRGGRESRRHLPCRHVRPDPRDAGHGGPPADDRHGPPSYPDPFAGLGGHRASLICSR